MLNSTKVLVISTPFFTDMLHETRIRIGDVSVQANESACNFGVMFDGSFEMSSHMQLRHLRSIKDTLIWDSLDEVTFISFPPGVL